MAAWHAQCSLDVAMKRYVTPLATMAAVLGLAASLVYVGSSARRTGGFDGARLMEAARAYTQDHRARRVPVPATVSVETLIRAGWLRESDVSGLKGMEVEIHLEADETHPGEALARMRTPDGHEIVLLSDGSVHDKGTGR